jgi:hypothetical protein
MQHLRSVCLTSALVLAAAGGPCFAADWRLVEVSGVVRVAAPGAEASAGHLNQLVPIGSSITTAAGGRAKLDNGAQQVVVGPNSRMTMAPPAAGGMDRVVQSLGSALFKIDKKQKPHFRVETPLLAAVVKGTTFTVVVAPQSDSVNVAEGLVEVRANGNGATQDVPGGSSAMVVRDAPGAVQVTSLANSAGPTPPAVAAPSLDYSTLSNGLVAGPEGPAGRAEASAGQQAQTTQLTGDGQPGTAAGGIPAAVSDTVRAETAISVAASQGPNGNGGRAGLDGPGRADTPGNGNGGAANGNHGNGNSGDGNSAGDGNGNSDGNGPGNGNGNSNGNNGNGNSGNGHGNSDGNGSGNGNNGAGNGSNGNGNGSANGNGNGNGNGNSGNGNSGNGDGSANGNGNNGNGNGSANGNGAGNGNGNGAGNGNGNSNNAEKGNSGNDTANGAGNGNSGDDKGNGNGNSGNGNGGGGGPVTVNLGSLGNVTIDLPGNGNGNNGNGNGNGGRK